MAVLPDELSDKGVDLLKNENSMAVGTANLVVATIAIGLVSYAVIYVGSRTFDAPQLSAFLSLWALVNTLALSLANPLETIAPQVLTIESRETHAARRLLPHPLVSHAIVFGLAAGVATVVISAALPSEATLGLQSGVIAFALSIGLWSGRRAMWYGSGDFSRARNGSLLNATAALLLLAVVFVVAPGAVAWLFLAVAGGNVIGATLWPRGSRQFDSNHRLLLPMGLYRVLWVLIGATAVTLVLQTGSLALANAWGIEPGQVVGYAALLSAVRVPMMLLNNVMGPLNLRIVRLATSGEVRSMRRLFMQGTGFILVAIPLFAGAAAILGPFAVSILVGSQYRVSSSFAAAVMVTECVFWLGMLPRFVLAALRANRVMAYCWSAGLVAFTVGALVLPSDDWKLVLVPLVGALVILGGAIPMSFKVLGRAYDNLVETQLSHGELSDS